ncbi:MAG: hypothetical protein FWG77_02880 [Treponema sp.]|nr:hypothetical protein [Treponema sp.]
MEKKDNVISQDMIIAVVNQGFSDDLVNTAREAGASGGTIMNARGLAHEGAASFFDISGHDEKEIILLLVDREKRVQMMQALTASHGLNTKAHGIIYSLPVDDVVGMKNE